MGARETLVAARDEHAAGYAAIGQQHAAPRAGIVGAGFIGAVHARSARLAGARLTGIATSSPERSREAAGRLGAERAYATAEALVTADDVDVVHICSPNATHAPLATLALEAGKHVICEKPLGRDASESYDAWQRVDAAGVKHMCAFNYRFVPAVRLARQMIEAVAFIHSKGVRHSDIKLSQWLLDKELNARLSDFNACGFDEQPALDLDGIKALGYEQPSHFMPRDPARDNTIRSDLFALGSALYELERGRCPYTEVREDLITGYFATERFPSLVGLTMGSIIAASWKGEFLTATQMLQAGAELWGAI